MKLTLFQIALYIIFIICILAISYYYNTQNLKEEFEIDINAELKTDLNTELAKINITDVGVKNKLINYMVTFKDYLKDFKDLQVPITINNLGKVCDPWDTYNNSIYKQYNNECININEDRKCLSTGNVVSCSNFYSDGKINELNKINIDDIINVGKYTIFTELNTINVAVTRKIDSINVLLNELITKHNLKNQQKYFIDYNSKNLDEKTQLLDKNNLELEKKENDVNIHKLQMQENSKLNLSNNKKISIYYTIIMWLIFLIIIVFL